MIRSTFALLAGVVLLAVGSTMAHAYTGIGAGEWTCGAFNQAGRFGKQLGDQWVVGYLSGLSNGSSTDVLAHTDYGAVTSWIDRYCASHPLDYVYQGADRLSAELLRRQNAQQR